MVRPMSQDEVCRGVILTRYKDNTYIFFVNIPEAHRLLLRHCVFCLLVAIYGIPMKWEPEACPQKWGVAQVYLRENGPSLTRKGAVAPSHLAHPPPYCGAGALDVEWANWIPAYSPNARLIVKTRVPAILNDSLWFACTKEDIYMNISSLSFGLATLGYPLSWWLQIVISFVRKWCLSGVIPYTAIRQWAVRGSTHRQKTLLCARDV